MDTIARLEAESACARLIHEYCHRIDAGDFEAFVALWAEDGVWETWKGPQRGHAAIRSYLAARQASIARHHCTNVIIELADAARAAGRSYFSFFTGAPAGAGPARLEGASVVGEYHDDFRKTAAGWRFARRRTIITLTAAANT